MSEFQLHFWDDGVDIEGERAQDRAQWCVKQEKGMTADEFKHQLGHADAVLEDTAADDFVECPA